MSADAPVWGGTKDPQSIFFPEWSSNPTQELITGPEIRPSWVKAAGVGIRAPGALGCQSYPVSVGAPLFLHTFKRQTSTPPPDSHDGLLLPLLRFQLHPHSILIRGASSCSLKTKLTFHHREAWVKRVMIEFLHFRELHLLSWGDVCKCRQSTERDSISVTLWSDGAASRGLASCLWTWRHERTAGLSTPWPRTAPFPPSAQLLNKKPRLHPGRMGSLWGSACLLFLQEPPGCCCPGLRALCKVQLRGALSSIT